MGTARGFDRLVFFTDAVTAIAITLLILPLVDLVPGYATHHGATIGGFITEYRVELLAFVLSFVIIGRLWLANHRTLEPVERASGPLMILSLCWAFTIVLLPLPTALIATFPHSDRAGILFYIGTMTASSLFLAAMSWEAYRRPELGGADRQATLINLWGVGSNAAAFVLALAVALVFPDVGFYSLLILLLTTPLDWIVKPRLRARTAAAHDASTA